MFQRKLIWFGAALALAAVAAPRSASADADRTRYPVVFAHGLSGFDNILGYDYWGNDYGNYVFDACDKFLETVCNGHIDKYQRSFVATVQPFHNSEHRGVQLADDIEGYMASSGASMVNIIGHSQGGIDMRKAATELRVRRGSRSVFMAISVSSPHRGTPLADAILEDFQGTVVEGLANIFGNIIYGSGNSAMQATLQLMQGDGDPNDGVATGMTAYNNAHPLSSSDAVHFCSFMTTQSGSSVNPALIVLSWLGYSIPGPDDGLVPDWSQQMGWRLHYDEDFWSLDDIYVDPANVGYLSNMNNPSSAQSNVNSYDINQDHADVIGVGPDTFDEEEFYAAIAHFIAINGG